MVLDIEGILNSKLDLEDQENIEPLPMPNEYIQEPFVKNPSVEIDPCQELDPKHIESNYESSQDQ
jgi:hypothetical protein